MLAASLRYTHNVWFERKHEGKPVVLSTYKDMIKGVLYRHTR